MKEKGGGGWVGNDASDYPSSPAPPIVVLDVLEMRFLRPQ